MRKVKYFVIDSPKNCQFKPLLASHLSSDFESNCLSSKQTKQNKVQLHLLAIKYASKTSDTKYKLDVKEFCVAKRKLFISGDIELNPGPQQCRNSVTRECSLGSSWALLTVRLLQL